jgi:hypothetical protein
MLAKLKLDVAAIQTNRDQGYTQAVTTLADATKLPGAATKQPEDIVSWLDLIKRRRQLLPADVRVASPDDAAMP